MTGDMTMPNPLEILVDPISLWAFALFGALTLVQALFPAVKLPEVKGWKVRALATYGVYFYLSSYLPLLLDRYLLDYKQMDISFFGAIGGGLVGVVIFEFFVYVWHRITHSNDILFRACHQMHHSVERIDTLASFYLGPLDMIIYTFLGSLSMVLILGLSPQAVTIFLFATLFLGIFEHTNIHTPRWLGYLIQRPESHTIHHGRGLHRYNYSDLPIYDILFGTFRNPQDYEMETGFYNGASARIMEMIVGVDVSSPREPHSGGSVLS
jgi:sterol desaturase/sphingolipid hydroxylase (fatty acid hydroxylase superfamily)